METRWMNLHLGPADGARTRLKNRGYVHSAGLVAQQDFFLFFAFTLQHFNIYVDARNMSLVAPPVAACGYHKVPQC